MVCSTGSYILPFCPVLSWKTTSLCLPMQVCKNSFIFDHRLHRSYNFPCISSKSNCNIALTRSLCGWRFCNTDARDNKSGRKKEFLFPFYIFIQVLYCMIKINNPIWKTWLGEYSHTESTGGTFPMALTAMSAKDWKLGLDFSTRKVISVDFILVNVVTIV